MQRMFGQFFLLALLPVVISVSPSTQGTPPCPWFDYSVARSPPLWKATLYPYGPISSEGVFYSTNQSIDSLDPSFGPWTPLPVRATASVEEAVILRDSDSSANITKHDVIEILDQEASLGFIRIGFGRNETYVGGYQGITLKHDYQFTCNNAWPTNGQVVTPVLAVGAVIALGTLAALMLRRSSAHSKVDNSENTQVVKCTPSRDRQDPQTFRGQPLP